MQRGEKKVKQNNLFKKRLTNRDNFIFNNVPVVFLLLLVILILFSILSGNFFTLTNFDNIICQGACLALISCGIMLTLITGGIDLSAGSVIGLSAVTVGLLMKIGFSIPIMIFGGLVVGIIAGLINGYLISYNAIPPFVATFGMMGMAHGIALVLTEGRVIWGYSTSFVQIANGKFLGLFPNPVVIIILVGFLLNVTMKNTKFGTSLYAIGQNEEAAIMSGITVARNKLIAYAICGLASGAAGIIMSSRMQSSMAVYGANYEFDAIAACVVGGVSFTEKTGKIIGVLGGVLFITVLRNGMNLAGVQNYWQAVLIGVSIIIAFAIDYVRKLK